MTSVSKCLPLVAVLGTFSDNDEQIPYIYLSGFIRYMDLHESCISGIDVNILKKKKTLNWIHKGDGGKKNKLKNTNHNVKVRYFIWLEFSKTKMHNYLRVKSRIKNKPFWHEERSHLWGKFWQSNQTWVDFWLSISNEIKWAFQGLCVPYQIKSINDSSDQDL